MSIKSNKPKPVYLMVMDVSHLAETEDGVGIEWGVDWGLEEGEELPEDVEELNEAQYTIWCMVKVLQGVGDDAFKAELERQRRERPSGILVPQSHKPI